MSESFFTDLPSFSDFGDMCQSKHYHPAPQDWLIVLTDVKGSTKAIEEGRYKDVNMIGAACISAAVNVCTNVDIPYVFGGDGATLLIPASYKDIVTKELSAIAQLALKYNDLSLRVGVIPVAEIYAQNKSFDVAKFEMSTGLSIAMFSGGGASLADEILKNDERFLLEIDKNSEDPNLEGLSCRWKPIPSQNGTIISLLVVSLSNQNAEETYNEINSHIDTIITQPANPARSRKLKYKWPTFETLRQSQIVWRQKGVLKKLLRHIFEITLFNILNRFGLKIPGLDTQQYKQDMIDNSDYRKFDDMLRMVIDCSQEQAQQINVYLQNKHLSGDIAYGLHYSETALMTCFVSNLQKNGHIHFIDGNDGGYAYAAKELKNRMGTC
ncbi:MAG: DUF3095 domain-containing protein [Alphaproteobacteria bacterium]|nr:DUF3095 domain-containing protein [Alphaproteobacteria bacterium]